MSAALHRTEDHPFWNATDRRFEEAQSLGKGDEVQSPDGRRSIVGGLRPNTTRTVQAYNLTVEGLHTYYVLAGSAPVLVHNVGECSVDGIPHGALGEFATLQRLQNGGYTNISSEVRFINSEGKIFRADFVAQDSSGNWVAFEVKTGTGGISPNQSVGYVDLGSGGGAILDTSGVPGLTKGTLINMKIEVDLWRCPLCDG